MANDLWRDCAQWLTRCGVLRSDHKANWHEATLTDLAFTLRDGVLLCGFLHSRDPTSINMKDVNQKPQFAQFLCLRNIKIFLQSCCECYGISKNDLFDPSMLFDLTDLYKVLNTLSKLSNCSKIMMQRPDIPGFSIHKPNSQSQEDIYRNLSAPGGEEASCAVTADFVEYAHYDTHRRNEEIYQDLCSIDKQSSPSSVYVPSAISHSFEKRDYVINELIETEKNYIEVLVTLQKCFIIPLRTILKEDDVKIIFGGLRGPDSAAGNFSSKQSNTLIQELHLIHIVFLSNLEKAVTPGSCYRLSEAFLHSREKFLIYGDYCANMAIGQRHIDELASRNDTINTKLKNCEREANNSKFKLRDILSVPMQRILKYDLLLGKLLSETQPGHEDYRGLERAKEAMVDVGNYINEYTKDSDQIHHIMEKIQNYITDWEGMENKKLVSFGRLLTDGDLRIKSHDNQKIRQRYVFVFDKIILMCKHRNDQYTFKCCLPLAEHFIENPQTSYKDSRWNHQWFLVRKSDRTAITLYARTEDSKKQWIRAIQDALDNIEPAGCRSTDHKFVMHTFDKPTTCTHCSKYLKGRIFQGYKCEKCSIPVHKMCIANSGRCGTNVPRPEPPPRPPLVARQESEMNGHSQPIPPRPSSGVSPTSWTDHSALADFLWFVGVMGREKATRLLEREVPGTFLLRIRPEVAMHDTPYAVSLKTGAQVKHMKVQEKEVDGVPHFYLSESRFFKSLVELINTYERTSLMENFVGLDVRLEQPLRRITARAEYDFTPVETNQLPLKYGDVINILSKEGDRKGWWKGQINDRVGFFPKSFARVVTDNLAVHIDLL